MTLLARLAAGAVLLGSLSTTAAQRPNDPAGCPYCGGDPERMAAAGLVSHGGFPFGTTDTAGVDGLLATSDVRWIETEHFRIGFALGSYKVGQDEKKKIRAELTELSQTLPEVGPRAKVLDPWLRVHLFALRVEKAWDRVLEVLQVDEGDFPDGATQWVVGSSKKFMGTGPYLGQNAKYEVLIVPNVAVQVAFLRDQFGLSIRKTQRWNIVDRDALTVVMHVQDGELRNDTALHGHVVFNLVHNLIDGYKHYSYETPLWIKEGLAHVLEREVDPDFNTFDSSEGAVAEMTRKSDWVPPVKKMILAEEAPRMAELLSLRSYAEFELEHHFATWSMTLFLTTVHPDGYACVNDRLHGALDARGFPDGSNMDDRHRDAFRDCLGMSYAEFDAAWREWALSLE